ncbi:Eda 2-keto-3-deoxy-6-phosphogluconate aldolase [Burkholderiales bacterium]|jgi:2-dehydro-3-deoxyphosphogluconate aldolase/(4S)-4-hydroxy-2-oxoglutarate aldolase
MSRASFPRFESKILPVIVLQSVEEAVPLAHAMREGGIDVLEITLRSKAGLPAIEAIAKAVPEVVVGAGTVLTPDDLAAAKNAGAQFALSPGATPELLAAGQACGIPFVPGVMTPSEAMSALAAGFELLKLFPASQAGGLGMLRAMAGPFPQCRFCPTGGITLENFGAFLALPNVAMVGGSWLTPPNMVQTKDWAGLRRLAQQATDETRRAQTL